MALASSIIYNELPRSPAKLFICKRILFWGCHNRGLLMNLKQVLSKRLQHQWCWGGRGRDKAGQDQPAGTVVGYLQPPSSSPLRRLCCLTDIKQNAHSWEKAARRQIGLCHPSVPMMRAANASLPQPGEENNKDDDAKVCSYARRIKMMMPRSVFMPEEREGADFEAPGHVS